MCFSLCFFTQRVSLVFRLTGWLSDLLDSAAGVSAWIFLAWKQLPWSSDAFGGSLWQLMGCTADRWLCERGERERERERERGPPTSGIWHLRFIFISTTTLRLNPTAQTQLRGTLLMWNIILHTHPDVAKRYWVNPTSTTITKRKKTNFSLFWFQCALHSEGGLHSVMD